MGMNRRDFIAAISGLVSCQCAHSAPPKDPLISDGIDTSSGGRSAVPSEGAGQVNSARLITPGCALFGAKSGDFSELNLSKNCNVGRFDLGMRIEYPVLCQFFQVKPAYAYFDDSSAPNAFATPEHIVPGGRDGSVVLGRTVIAQMLTTYGESAGLAVAAHEFAHICQFANNVPRVPGKPLELFADFLAGWYLTAKGNPEVNGREVYPAIYSTGDTNFNSPGHHGTPQERASAVAMGYSAAANRMPLPAAFRYGFQKFIR